jgi:thioredoxin-like negative regulator of GroEL
MAIEGPLKELGIHDVFQLLDLNRKTGVLRVTSELRHNQGTVWFENGTVIYAEIRNNPHPLGELLVRARKINESDLDRARSMQEQGDERQIGDLLIAIGAIKAVDLERQVRFQIEEVIFEMMSWREGYFSFVEQPVDSLNGRPTTQVRIEALLMEGARRIDEWSRMERKIPHVGVVPTLAAATDDAEGQLDLLPAEWEVLASIDGTRDIRAIASSLARSEFDVAKTIFGLEAAGAVSIVTRASGQRMGIDEERDADGLLALAHDALDANDLEGARSVIETALESYPHDARLFVELGRIQLAGDRDAEAEETLRRALRLDAQLADAHRLLGNALVRQGRFEEASGWWDRWLKLSAEHGGSPEDIRAVERAAEAAKLLERVVRRERG